MVVEGAERLREGSKVELKGPGHPATSAERQVMNPSRIFILRPVATTLLMAAILLAGAVAYHQLPVSALPQVDYPTIQVLTFFPGASPDVMASSVTAPLERQFGQMPGLKQMTSNVLRRQFGHHPAIQPATQPGRGRTGGAGGHQSAATFLPRDLPNPPVYSKVNPADAPILTLALTSETLPLPKVEDLADTRLAQKISQLPGVGLVSISGGQRPAVRIQANPTALAAYGLTLEDLRTAIAAANTNQAKGGFDGPRQSSIIGANDQLFTGQEYRPLIVAFVNGAPVKLSDLADAVDSAENVKQAAWMNDTPAVIVNIQRQPGSNVIEVVDRIKKLLPQLQSALPPAVQVTVLTDRTTTIRGSVEDVQFELMLAVALVVLVIFLFLRNLPATIIPSVAVPLSLVGTFGVMYLLGFSLNNLTLMALTIATGFVVDDAIVMIENVSRYIEQGDPPLQAALKGSEQIAFTILSLTVSLIAVLIPVLFMGEVVGRLFREFAITLGVTILISAVVSLTLTPMMCARLLKHTPEEQQSRLFRASQRVYDRIIDFYAATLRWVLKHQTGTLLVAVGHPGHDGAPVYRRAQGLLSGAGHRHHPGHLGGPAIDLLSRHGGAPAGPGPGDPARPGGGQPLHLHRGGRHQYHPQQRPGAHQPEAAGRAPVKRQRDHPPPAAASSTNWRASGCSCSRCRT